MNKKIVLIAIILGLTIGLTGCKEKKQYNAKRVVIEDDVSVNDKEDGSSKNYKNSKAVNSNSIEHVTSKTVEFQLEEGYYFYPCFYYQGEVYGYFWEGHGYSNHSDLEREAQMEYLYKIDKDNNLVRTSKMYHNYLQGRHSKVYPQDTKFINFVEDVVFTVDYKIEDIPKPWPELTDVVNKLKGDSRHKLYFIRPVSENENYLIISEGIINDGSDWKRYIYDIENNKIYKMKNEEREGAIYYVNALQSLVWVDDKDFKIYKIVFKDEYYDLEEYIDLNRYGKADKIEAVMKDNDEMILFMDKNVEGYLFKTIYIGKLNFKTNQYNLLLEAPKEINIYAEYVGHNILLIEEFKINDRVVIPVKRYLKQVLHDEMNAILEEEPKEESEQWYLNKWIVISEDGKEMFDAMEINKMKGVLTTEKMIYQKYYIKYSDD
ncbi:hypothetical protein ACF3M2_11705 [Tissierella carlieri]|uniref:hypothetical protein n=1 Tax=Tissierella carlieri TaxID=689904 RepID=UPI00386D02CD